MTAANVVYYKRSSFMYLGLFKLLRYRRAEFICTCQWGLFTIITFTTATQLASLSHCHLLESSLMRGLPSLHDFFLYGVICE